MHPVEALERLGGAATTDQLLRLTGRAALRRALAAGQVLHPSRGSYALPTADDGVAAATRLRGVASHASAAALHGWELPLRPVRPSVIVPRGRRLTAQQQRGVDVRYRALQPHEVHGDRTSPIRTVLDCAKDLPFPVALSIADSALRADDVDPDLLQRRALELPTTGRRQALRVVAEMDLRAANPFESVLRALALDVPGLSLTPQLQISDGDFHARPDLVDDGLRIAVEADSFGFHATRDALRRDCERYNALGVRGWLVLRFSWEHVMFEPRYVQRVLGRAVAARRPQDRQLGEEPARLSA